MLSNVARFLMASAAVSLVAFGSAPADACADISDGALDIIDGVLAPPTGTTIGAGAGFFTWTQKLVYGVENADIFNLWGSNGPSSAVYYDNFAAQNNVGLITNASNIAAGDVLVLDATGTYSGHTVIIIGAPIQLGTLADPELNPKFVGTKQWALPIADTTSSVHGCNAKYPDSRWTGTCASGTFAGGPGTAYMRLYSDLSGNLQGHSWSVTSGATYYSPTTRPYVIGRLTACPLFP